MSETHPRVNILGVNVSACGMEAVLETLGRWIARRDHEYVCVTPAHSIMDCREDPSLRRIFNASGLTTPDGMAIVWLLWIRGHRKASRVYGPDLLTAACERSATTGWRHFFCGGGDGVPEQLAARLEERFPGLSVAGTATPPFGALSEAEDQHIVDTINRSQADIVWVGLGSPKQERWMGEHLGRVDAPVLIGVGAAFDYLSGRKRQAPRWVQRSGFEWLFRWASEPRRLTRRYARYPAFVVLAAAQLFGLKRFPTE